MARHEEPLTLQGKNITTNLGGLNLRPSSKNGCDSKAAGLRLSPGCGEDAAAQLTEAGALPEGAARRERENLPPPRRPLKLAPLELPMEVKESQRHKIKGIQQEAMAASRKLDALGNEPRPRKARTDPRGERAGSAERPPRRPLRPPAEREAPGPVKAPLPAAQVRPSSLPRVAEGARADAPRGRAALPSKPALPPGLDGRAPAARAAGNPGTFQDAGRRRRPRLRRAQGVDEDQGKLSVSTTPRLSTEEGKEGPAGSEEEGQRVEKVLREAGRVLDRASRRQTRPLRHMGNVELSGKPVKRTAAGDVQDAAL